MDKLLTRRQTAEALGISQRSLDRMGVAGPPRIRVTPSSTRGRVMYRESAVAAWLRQREQGRAVASPEGLAEAA